MTSSGTAGELGRLLAPLSFDRFLASHHERAPLLVDTRDRNRFDGLLDRTTLFHVLAYGCVGRQDARAVRDGAVDKDRALFDGDGHASALGMAGAFADGCTIVLNNVQRRVPAVAALARQFECAFGQPVGANAYLTPPGGAGLAPHFDDHDVFVLQLEGTKYWYVHPPASDLPLRGGHFDVDPIALGDALVERSIGPGSLFYIPRGFVHRAQAGTEASLHLTLGLSCYRQLDVVSEAVTLWGQSVHDARRAADLADGDVSACAVDLQPHMRAARQQVELRFIQTLAPLEDVGFDLAREAEALSPHARVRHRTGTLCRAAAGPEGARIHFPGNVVVCPAPLLDVLDYVSRTPAFRIRDIPGIDEASALLLARKLMVSGLLVPAAA